MTINFFWSGEWVGVAILYGRYDEMGILGSKIQFSIDVIFE